MNSEGYILNFMMLLQKGNIFVEKFFYKMLEMVDIK